MPLLRGIPKCLTVWGFPFLGLTGQTREVCTLKYKDDCEIIIPFQPARQLHVPVPVIPLIV